MASKKKSKWVEVEWQGPTYSVPVNSGRELFDLAGKWDYGMHVRGDKFVVLRSDAENDNRFMIVGTANAPDDIVDPDEEDDDDEVQFADNSDTQPPSDDDDLSTLGESLKTSSKTPPKSKK